MTSRDDLRIGDAERDEVMAALREHFAQGRLTHEELDERLDTALAARTAGELRRVTADLPFPARRAAAEGDHPAMDGPRGPWAGPGGPWAGPRGPWAGPRPRPGSWDGGPGWPASGWPSPQDGPAVWAGHMAAVRREHLARRGRRRHGAPAVPLMILAVILIAAAVSGSLAPIFGVLKVLFLVWIVMAVLGLAHHRHHRHHRGRLGRRL
ncbi:DUF1707 domain-containing protein [Sphaerisporangium sp. NPDC005289]|uniref:DUF1707 SHOCT-like domain-containing protein n=1 Tax=Sphaerisporangium sp. NPDC005289 TaxID=3155247 RepID=UPI0033A4FA60